MLRIYGREIGVAQREFPVAQLHGPLFEIDLIQQQPVFHMVLRMRHDTLPFHLELADGNGLVHLRCQRIIHRVELVFIQPLRLEKLTRIVAVDVFCHGRQRTKIDAVSDFQHIEIVITDIHSQHVGDAGPVACSCAHPYDIVISPLEIHIVIIHEKVHD